MKNQVQTLITSMMQEGCTRRKVREALEAKGFQVNFSKMFGKVSIAVAHNGQLIGRWEV